MHSFSSSARFQTRLRHDVDEQLPTPSTSSQCPSPSTDESEPSSSALQKALPSEMLGEVLYLSHFLPPKGEVTKISEICTKMAQQTVLVCNKSNKRAYLTLNDDETLSRQTLTSFATGATGIQYKEGDRQRLIVLNITGEGANARFIKPRDATGWNRDFYAVYPENTQASLPDSGPDQPSVSDNLAELVFEKCRKYLYFSKLIGIDDDGSIINRVTDEGENSKFIVTVFGPRYAATTYHNLKTLSKAPNMRNALVGDEFSIYSCVKPADSVSVTVVKILPESDYVILKSSTEFPDYPEIATARQGMRAVCLGFPVFEDVINGNVVEKQISEKEPVPFPVEVCAVNIPRPNMLAASCGLANGFSGGGLRVYGKSEQLLGLCQRGRVPPKEWQNKWAMEGWLHRRSVSYFVSSVAIHSVIEGIVT